MSDLHDEVYRYLQQVQHPCTLHEILEHLQEVTNRSRGELMSRIALEQDSRFVKRQDRYWGLANAHTPQQQQIDFDNQGVTEMLNQEIIAPLLQLMSETLTQMKQTEQEIPNKVIELFESEDIEGIQKLLEEKKKFTEFTSDLREFLNKWMTA
jgi:DNA-directed RNA polymerase delta subunit